MRGRQLYDYFLHTFKEEEGSSKSSLSYEVSKKILPNKIYIDPSSQSLYFKTLNGAATAN